MKNIKGKLIAAIVAGSMIIPAFSANAATIGSGLVKEQQRLLNQQTRQQIQQLRQTIRNNEKTNADLISQNRQLRQSVRNIVQQIKQSKKIVPAGDLSNIEAQIQVIKTDSTALTSTKTNMQSDRNAAKGDIQSKNWQDLTAQLNNIISVQGTRMTDLQKLNQDLNTLLKDVQTAQTDATAPPANTQTSSSTATN